MADFDPIELELFKNLFVSISEEMGAVLERTALSPNIKERKDFSCALFTNEGNTFAQGSFIPVHLGAMPLSVKAAMSAVDFNEGDLVILNDPYQGGTHLPDITCVTPVFFGGKLQFFIANRAHHSDVGGMTPGSMPLATEVFQEGVIIPPLKLIKKGEINQELLNLLLANVRTPDERRGDLLAQIASNNKGKLRLEEVISKFGLKKIRNHTKHIQDYTERFLREALLAIPNGIYSFSDYMDDDGINDKPTKISVKITIIQDQATIDFSGSDLQVEGGINANFAVTSSAVLYVFRSLVEEDIPFNTGLVRPLTITAPKGLVINAKFPSATAAGNVETSQRIVDVLLGALSKALPARIPAASSGTMNNISFGGYDPIHRRSFAYYETIGGGMGAALNAPGLSGIHTHMTNSLNTPLEAMENYFPLRIRQYGLRRNSGGNGKFKGGDGIVREYEFFVPTQVSIMSERRKFPPYGLKGGNSGKPGRNILISGSRIKLLRSKVNFKIKPGEILRIETPGGGGYGRKT